MSEKNDPEDTDDKENTENDIISYNSTYENGFMFENRNNFILIKRIF